MGSSVSRAELLPRMEGEDVGLCHDQVQFFRRLTFRDSPYLDKSLSCANRSSLNSLKETFDGLCLEFEKKHHFDCSAILIRAYGELIPEGLLRVTTPLGFLCFFHNIEEFETLQSFRNIVDIVNKTGQTIQHEREECPICMDRIVDAVLGCGHSICKVCEFEWLVGEGRGTCPICRSRQNENDDWVLNEYLDQENFNELTRKIDTVSLSLILFLAHLPTWKEYCEVCHLSFTEDESGVYDGLGFWLKGRLAYQQDNQKKHQWGKCPKCTTYIRIPETAFEATRLVCNGCRQIWPIDALKRTNVIPCLYQTYV